MLMNSATTVCIDIAHVGAKLNKQMLRFRCEKHAHNVPSLLHFEMTHGTHAAVLAVRILGAGNRPVMDKMQAFLNKQEQEVLDKSAKVEKLGYQEYIKQMVPHK
jgi:hypothetical protein